MCDDMHLSDCRDVPNSPAQKLVEELKLWRDGGLPLGKQRSYINLRNTLDEFSIFAGRNPLEVARGMYSK